MCAGKVLEGIVVGTGPPHTCSTLVPAGTTETKCNGTNQLISSKLNHQLNGFGEFAQTVMNYNPLLAIDVALRFTSFAGGTCTKA